jgi:hypothetical protein
MPRWDLPKLVISRRSRLATLHIPASTPLVPRIRRTATCELSYYCYDPSDNSNLPGEEDVDPDTGSSAFSQEIGAEGERRVCSATVEDCPD